VLIGLGVYAAAALIILSGGQMMPWQYGQHVPSDIRARVAFTVTDEKLTEDNRRKARLATPNVYVRNEALLTSIAGKLRELFALAKSSEDSGKFIAAAGEKGWHVDEKDYAALKNLASEPSGSGAQLFEDRVNALSRFLAGQYVVEKVNDPTRPTAPEQSLLKWNTTGQRRVFTSELQYVSDTEAVTRIAEEGAKQNLSGPLDPLVDDVSRLIVQSLQPDAEKKKFDPIYRYDALATAKLMDENERAVAKVVSSYNAGDVLVKGGTNITEEQLALLRHEHEAYRRALSTDWALRRAQPELPPGVEPVAVRPVVCVWYNEDLSSRKFIIPGLVVLLMMMLAALLTSQTVVREREQGTIEGLVVSPVTAGELILGKLLPYVAIALADVATVAAVGLMVFHAPMRGGPALLLGLMLVYLLAALGAGLLISVSTRTQQSAFLAAFVATLLPTMLLTGFVFPVSSMPKVLQALVQLHPATHFMVIVRAIALKGAGMAVLWPRAAATAALAAALLGASVMRFRKAL